MKREGKISLIVAVSENGVIGKDGALPWRISEDLRRFKKITLGKPCIMGRKTWDSLPKKPLPGRTNIVVTRNPVWAAEGALTAHDVADALAVAAQENPEEIMVIGGEAIFAATLPLAHRIYLTEVSGNFVGDAHMPALDRSAWREVENSGPLAENGITYRYVTFARHGE